MKFPLRDYTGSAPFVIFNHHEVPATLLKALLQDGSCSQCFRAAYLPGLFAFSGTPDRIHWALFLLFVFLISRALWHSMVIKLSVKNRWLVAKMRKGSGKFSDEVFGE